MPRNKIFSIWKPEAKCKVIISFLSSISSLLLSPSRQISQLQMAQTLNFNQGRATIVLLKIISHTRPDRHHPPVLQAPVARAEDDRQRERRLGEGGRDQHQPREHRGESQKRDKIHKIGKSLTYCE